MTINEFYNQLLTITGNRDKTVEDRIDNALELNEQVRPDDEVMAARFDSIAYGVVASMLDKENICHTYDVEMMQALTLQAEAMIRGKTERSLKDFRKEVDTLIADGHVPFDTLIMTVGRIVKALRPTVFNHDRYGILDAFIRRRVLQNPLCDGRCIFQRPHLTS